MKRFNFLINAVVLLGVSAPTFADQRVTLRVPVTLNNIDSKVKLFRINCSFINSSKHRHVVGTHKDISVTGRSAYNGVVSLTHKLTQKQVEQVDYYRCGLRLLYYVGQTGCAPSYNSKTDSCRAKSGSQLVVNVEGRLGTNKFNRGNVRVRTR